jgi:hypothetical protein
MNMHTHAQIDLSGFAANARYYASADLLATLAEVARVRDLALIVDVGAMKLDRVIATALDALAQADVVPVVIGDVSERVRWARSALGRTWFVDRRRGWAAVVANIRASFAEPCIVAFSDQIAARTVLSDRDRLILTEGHPHMTGRGVAVSSGASLRVALWCLVRERLSLRS